MILTDTNKIIGQRADIYKLLSLLYYQPQEEISDYIKNLKEIISQYMYSDMELVNKMEKDLEGIATDANHLLVDYAKLFIGPFDVLAAPYGSIYLDNERKVMGDSTMDACKQYAAAGLEIAGSFKESPDHIAVELEFLYYLNYRYLEKGETLYLKMQRDFLHTHLGLWIDQFTEAVMKNSQTEFYRNLVLLTQKFIKEDIKFLKEINC